MSINDILNDDSFLPTIFVLFIIIMVIAIPVGISRSKRANQEIYGDGDTTSSTRKRAARIASRRNAPHPLAPTVNLNLIVFEFEDHSRIELAIKDTSIYSTLIEGDQGILTYQGKQFISFKRSIENES